MHFIAASVNGVVLNVREAENIVESCGYRGIDQPDHCRRIVLLR